MYSLVVIFVCGPLHADNRESDSGDRTGRAGESLHVAVEEGQIRVGFSNIKYRTATQAALEFFDSEYEVIAAPDSVIQGTSAPNSIAFLLEAPGVVTQVDHVRKTLTIKKGDPQSVYPLRPGDLERIMGAAWHKAEEIPESHHFAGRGMHVVLRDRSLRAMLDMVARRSQIRLLMNDKDDLPVAFTIYSDETPLETIIREIEEAGHVSAYSNGEISVNSADMPAQFFRGGKGDERALPWTRWRPEHTLSTKESTSGMFYMIFDQEGVELHSYGLPAHNSAEILLRLLGVQHTVSETACELDQIHISGRSLADVFIALFKLLGNPAPAPDGKSIVIQRHVMPTDEHLEDILEKFHGRN